MGQSLPDLWELVQRFVDWANSPIHHRDETPRNAYTLRLRHAHGMSLLANWLKDEGAAQLAVRLQADYEAVVRQAEELDHVYSTATGVDRKNVVAAEEQAFKALALRLAHLLERIDGIRIELVSEGVTSYAMPTPPAPEWRHPRTYPTFREAGPRELLDALTDWLKYPHLIARAVARKDKDEAVLTWTESLQAGALAQRAALQNDMSPEEIARRDIGLASDVGNAGFLENWDDVWVDIDEGARDELTKRINLEIRSESSAASIDLVQVTLHPSATDCTGSGGRRPVAV